MSSGRRNILRWNRRSEDHGASSEVDNLSQNLDGSNLSLSEAGINSSPLSLRRGGSTRSSNQRDASADYIADKASSKIGSNSTSRRGHSHHESISSNEGSQPYSKRTHKSSKLRESVYGGEMGGPGFPPRNGYSGDSSSSHETATEGAYSDSTSPARPAWTSLKSPMRANLPELDSEFSMRMEEQRDQRMANQFRRRDEMRYGRNDPERYGLQQQVPNNHYRAVQSPHCCLHCRGEVCGAFLNISQVCCSDGSCRSCSHTCCYPSAASASHCHADPNPRMDKRMDAGMDIFLARERNQPRKRSDWPIFGGTRYLVCYKCNDLIQIPEDFEFLGVKCNRMRCGSCREVISYSLVDKTRIVCSGSSEFSGQTPSGNGNGDGTGTSGGTSLYGGPYPHPQSIYGEDYSSTEYEADEVGSTNRWGGERTPKNKQRILHKMMGYASATEILH